MVEQISSQQCSSRESCLTATIEDTKQRGGKYLTFVLAEEDYGIEILKVREIIGMMDITRVPRTPDFVKGVVNLRGKIIPVIDLRRKFGMETVKPTAQTCIIVVDAGPQARCLCHVEIGIVVDEVSEVLDIAEDEIEDSPSFGISGNTDFILGIGKADNKVTILLDIAKVLT